MTDRAPSILIVDDEEMVLTSLRGVFTLQTDYHVVEADAPEKALEELRRTPIDLVISDFLMPEMNGIEFLKEAKILQPDSVRVLLTGYADKENAIKAINEVGLYHYLEKPWDNDALLNIVKNGLAEKSLRRMLSDKVRELDMLSSRHEKLEVRHRFLERELEMAARVQRSLLPSELPSFGRFRFANLYRPSVAVGGDFFDLARSGDAAVLLVSDVIGHGVQAALTTMLLKGFFQESAADTDDPKALLEEMNRRLHAILPSGMYAAAAALTLRADDATVRFSNAGLPYPFVLRRARRLDEIALSGPPLGLFEGRSLPFESRTIEMKPGDVLLVGSDGIGSIQDSEGAFFEDFELRRALERLTGNDGDVVVTKLLEWGLAFGNNAPLPDDVNLVALTHE